MVTLFLTLALMLAAVVGVLRWLRLAPATLDGWAWRGSQVACALFLLSVAVYRKPQSFYTNFAILPSLMLFLVGIFLALVAIVTGLVAAVRGQRRGGLNAVGLALVSTVSAWLVILWRAS
jgi:hypothetical protein